MAALATDVGHEPCSCTASYTCSQSRDENAANSFLSFKLTGTGKCPPDCGKAAFAQPVCHHSPEALMSEWSPIVKATYWLCYTIPRSFCTTGQTAGAKKTRLRSCRAWNRMAERIFCPLFHYWQMSHEPKGSTASFLRWILGFFFLISVRMHTVSWWAFM